MEKTRTIDMPGNAVRQGMREISLARMDALSEHYRRQAGVRAMLAFGSLGDTERFDDFSDLDFLVVCTSESKGALLDGVSDLTALNPVAYRANQYGDAVKLLFEDGVLCDYGIVTEEQLASIGHGEGRILWKRADFSGRHTAANLPDAPTPERSATVGEILMHLYVGLLRERRGEKAAAFEEVQILAAGLLLKLLRGDTADPFSPLRRAERAGIDEKILGGLMPGYGRSGEAVSAALALLDPADCPAGLLRQIRVLL